MEQFSNHKFYQLGNGGSLVFEKDLDALSDFLDRPHPEFFGRQINDQPCNIQIIYNANDNNQMHMLRILFYSCVTFHLILAENKEKKTKSGDQATSKYLGQQINTSSELS